jgi:hypothetical protein
MLPTMLKRLWRWLRSAPERPTLALPHLERMRGTPRLRARAEAGRLRVAQAFLREACRSRLMWSEQGRLELLRMWDVLSRATDPTWWLDHPDDGAPLDLLWALRDEYRERMKEAGRQPGQLP